MLRRRFLTEACSIAVSVRWRTDGAARFVFESSTRNRPPNQLTENTMYYGGGILGTILLVVLIVYFIRRT